MKTKDVLYGLFVVAGSVCGALYFESLYRWIFEKPVRKSRLFDIRIDLMPGISFGDAVREVMATAEANRCEVCADFDGLQLSARPGENVLLVLQRYSAAAYAAKSAAAAHAEFEQFRAEESARAAADLERQAEPDAEIRTEKTQRETV